MGFFYAQRKNALTQSNAKGKSRKERNGETSLWQAKLKSTLSVIPPRALRERVFFTQSNAKEKCFHAKRRKGKITQRTQWGNLSMASETKVYSACNSSAGSARKSFFHAKQRIGRITQRPPWETPSVASETNVLSACNSSAGSARTRALTQSPSNPAQDLCDNTSLASQFERHSHTTFSAPHEYSRHKM
jgi:hypothetical protein